jgi:alkylhydroperoxidase family enzyme
MNLTELLHRDAVPMETLHQRYGSLLELVRKLIGVIPNCDRYLEIWPPAFRSYNVMVPNLLNLPLGIVAPKRAVGLAMYVASRAAGCAYCSAHVCSFALRRGATPATVAQAFDGQPTLAPPERAAIAVARALAVVPSAISAAERAELRRSFSAADVEWIVLGIAMMGFLNKFMDAIGVELESATVQEVNGVIAASGWTPGKHGTAPTANGVPPPRPDGIATKLGIVPYLPAALALDRKWTAGVPDRWPAVADFLRDKTGHAFPVLSRLRHRRAIRAIATMIAANFDAAESVVGLATKRAAGLVYADVVGDAALAAALGELRAPASAPGAPDAAALTLARAVSPSPAQVDQAVVDASRPLAPAAIVEVVAFISVLQLLHRLGSFYA